MTLVMGFCVCMFVGVHVYRCAYACSHARVCVCVCVSVSVCVCLCVCLCVCESRKKVGGSARGELLAPCPGAGGWTG
jgi:hypothetical protein